MSGDNARDRRRRDRPEAEITAESFREDFGEPLSQVLDLDTWRPGADLAAQYARLEEEVFRAVECETDAQREVRECIHPLLADAEGAPPGAGVYSTNVEELEEVNRG